MIVNYLHTSWRTKPTRDGGLKTAANTVSWSITEECIFVAITVFDDAHVYQLLLEMCHNSESRLIRSKIERVIRLSALSKFGGAVIAWYWCSRH